MATDNMHLKSEVKLIRLGKGGCYPMILWRRRDYHPYNPIRKGGTGV